MNENYETFEEFINAVKDRLCCVFQDRVADITNVRKNNGVVMTGITLKNNESNLAPTIYMEPFYSKYKRNMDFSAVINEIINDFEMSERKDSFDIECFNEYDRVKDRIVYKIINKEKNIELLKEIPYVEFLDMAIVFYYILDKETWNNATILIRNQHLDMWKVSRDKVYKDSIINTEKLLEYDIKDLHKVMEEVLLNKFHDKYENENCPEEMIDDIVSELLGDNIDMCPVPMYVLSNKYNVLGAASILYNNLLLDFSENFGSDIIILPSSIHEVILVPENKIENKKNLSVMVKEVNSTQVADEEVLSDSVYIFRRDKNMIEMLDC